MMQNIWEMTETLAYGSRLRVPTVPTFNSCTKCVGSPGIIHDRMPQLSPGSPCMDDLTTERSIDSQATRVIDVFAYSLTCYPWVFV